MKKNFFTSFALAIIIASSLFPWHATQAAETKMKNCSWEALATGQTFTQICFAKGKSSVYPANCADLSKPVPYSPDADLPCCCNIVQEYSCTWKKRVYVPSNHGAGQYVGGCGSTETPGPDCDLSKKPASGTNTEVFCCCQKTNTVSYSKANFTLPQLQIPIDTISLSDAKCTGEDHTGNCEIPWIAEYINGIYKYGLGIGGILAAIMLMAGGVLWLLSAGDASSITKAKDLIIGSITGLMILVGTYFLLVTINPELTTLKSVSIKMIERKILESDVEGQGAVSLDLEGISRVLGVECGSVGVKDLVDKSKGKVTYNNPNRGKTGPGNTVYNDCSGYANFVLKCALNKAAASQTADFFSDQVAWDGKANSLQAGDLIGWAPKNSSKNEGHVFIYLGDNLFGDCHGGDSGRQTGNCISNNLSIEDIKASAGRHSGGKLFFKRY
ncbi:MAG: hypothetical protein Q8Q67_00175 [bacterium]|nr:hypothetical protein [bacterium]